MTMTDDGDAVFELTEKGRREIETGEHLRLGDPELTLTLQLMWQAERARIDMRSKEVDRICDEMIDYFGHPLKAAHELRQGKIRLSNVTTQ